jgi:lipopolysaccharide export system permease protein
LNEHVGPFVFALSALTSLLLLQYIARKFGDLVGKGLAWSVIAEFMLLSIPFTLAMTLPMAMLVAVLYAFSRLASENEITALKAGGISTRGLMRPAVGAATGLAIFMLWFNDQVLPRANHELATLTTAIGQTKPTFALRPQVINTIKESQLYLRAGRIDQSTGLMTDVTIYDVSDAAKRNTIYANSARLALNPNMRDMTLRLYTGMMISAPTNQPGQLNRVYYKQALRQVRDVAGSFKPIDADTTSKGDREMSVCEMQRQYERANDAVQRAQYDSLVAAWRIRDVQGRHVPAPKPPALKKAGGIGAVYCAMITRYFHMNELHAAEPPRQDTTKQRPVKAVSPVAQATAGNRLKAANQNQKKAGNQVKTAASVKPPASGIHRPPVSGATAGAGIVRFPPTPSSLAPSSGMTVGNQMELTDAHLRLDDARYRRNRAGVEIQKKFSLAFACIVFVLVGAPLAVRFPRGGVGLVIGASFLIFAIYYIGLIGGEALSDKNIISPFWAMWTDNVIFLVAGLLLMTRMGRESGTGRGGGIGEIFEGVRGWFARQGRRLGATPARRVDD